MLLVLKSETGFLAKVIYLEDYAVTVKLDADTCVAKILGLASLAKDALLNIYPYQLLTPIQFQPISAMI